MLARFKQKWDRANTISALQVTGICLCIGMSLYAPDTFALSLAKPIVKMLTKLKVAMLMIGKSVLLIAAVAAIIMFICGQPNYKWMAYIAVGGACLTGFTYVASFLAGI